MTNDCLVDCHVDSLGRRWRINNCSELPKCVLSVLFNDVINCRYYTASVVDR
jgi:hypothetical protein